MRTSAMVCGVLALLLLAGSVPLQRGLAAAQPSATLDDPLFISSPQVVKRLSLGYSGLLADLYWTRVVQYFGRKHLVRPNQYDLLAPLLDITTTLDPHLTVAYEFGSTFLAQPPPEGSGQPQLAVKLIHKGIHENPDNWHLYYTLGFLYYENLHDYPAAAKAFEDGSRVPGARPWMKIMAARVAQEAGNRETSHFLWTNIYSSTEDPSLKENALRHLAALKVDHDVTELQSLVSEYERRTGSTPASFADLVRAGIVPGIPEDPTGRPYQIQNGSVVVSRPESLPFITKGLPLGARTKQDLKGAAPLKVDPDELFRPEASK